MAWLTDAAQDLRYAVRTLRRSPGFVLIAVLTLGLGIGATTAISSVVQTILLRPLPFRDSDRLVSVVQNMPPFRAGARSVPARIYPPQLLQWRERTATLAGVVGVASSIAIVKTEQGTARLWGGITDATTLPMLGARAMLGRTLVEGDESNPNVVVLSFDTWRRLFQSDRGIIGRSLEFLTTQRGARAMTVVGVMPAEFEFPTERMEFLVPFDFGEAAWQQGTRLTILARLREGVTPDTAVQEAMAIGTAITPPLPADALPLIVPRFELRNLKDIAIKELRPRCGCFLPQWRSS